MSNSAHKTISDYRGILSEEIDKLRNGNTSAANLNAVTNAVGKVLSTVKLELEYVKITGKTPKIDMLEAAEA